MMKIFSAQERSESKEIIYREISDGWFTYYYCGVCGNKALNRPKVCPKCGRKVDQTVKGFIDFMVDV